MVDIENVRFSIAKNKDKDIIKERQLRVRKRNKEANMRYKNRVKQYLKEKHENEKKEQGERE